MKTNYINVSGPFPAYEKPTIRENTTTLLPKFMITFGAVQVHVDFDTLDSLAHATTTARDEYLQTYTCRCEHEDHFGPDGDAPEVGPVKHLYGAAIPEGDRVSYVAAVGRVCQECAEGHMQMWEVSDGV